MVYSKIYIVLIFWICVVSGSDFRSGFRTSPPKNSLDTRKHDLDDINDNITEREEKIFSLFSIVQFKNEGGQSTSSRSSPNTGQSKYGNGTCFTSQECSDKGGSAYGGCAAGFGVCCIFLYSSSGSTIVQNCSYIQNPDYPSNYGSTTSITYTIQKCDSSVCSLRLDFETFTTQGLSATTELAAITCQDTFIISGSITPAPPTICGENTGQHVYVDLGTSSSDTATLAFAFNTGSTTATRAWEIKVAQIPCGSTSDPPTGCLQYHTGITGRFETFNYPATSESHLPSQEYSVRIRQEEG